MKRLLIVAITIALLTLGCALAGAETIAVQPNVSKADYAVHWYRDSAEMQACYVQTFHTALTAISARVKTEKLAPKTWGIILDADDTVLDNSDFEKFYYDNNLKIGSKELQGWWKKAAATACPGAKEFLRAIHELGGYISIVTNRNEPFVEDTALNLRAEGLKFDQVIGKNSVSDKTPRFVAVQNGKAPSKLPAMKILAWIGDNITDFPGCTQAGVYNNEKSGVFAHFGVDWFILPNPMYGSWESSPYRAQTIYSLPGK